MCLSTNHGPRKGDKTHRWVNRYTSWHQIHRLTWWGADATKNVIINPFYAASVLSVRNRLDLKNRGNHTKTLKNQFENDEHIACLQAIQVVGSYLQVLAFRAYWRVCNCAMNWVKSTFTVSQILTNFYLVIYNPKIYYQTPILGKV